jgi:membrane protease YdiL (CAAX protease family)
MDERTLILAGSEVMGVIAVMLLAGLSKSIRQRPLLGFKYPRRETVISLSLFGLLLALSILFYSGSIPAPQPFVSVPSELWQQLIASLIALLLVLALLTIRRQPIRSAGWSKAMLNPSLRLGLALAFLAIFLRGAIFSLMDGVSSAELSGLMVWLLLALAETTIFQGYIQLRLASFFGDRFGWLVAAAIFFLWQLPRLLLQSETIWIRLAVAAIQAVLLSWLMKRSGHVAGIALYRAVSGWIWLL